MFKFIRRYNSARLADENRADLLTLLSGLKPGYSYEERMDALRKIVQWLRQPVSAPNGPSPDQFQARNVRLKFILQFLERHPDQAQIFIASFQEIINRGMAVRLYCLTGISENTGFFNELTDRMIQNFLPPTFRERDLAEIFKLIFTEDEDAIWFENYSFEIIPPFKEVIKKYNISLEGLRLDQKDALIILGSQVASLGISKHIRRHLGKKQISESSFVKLAMAINREESDSLILDEVSKCRLNLQDVRKTIEESGVSVDLIYHMEKIEALLNRIEMILYLRHSDHEEEQSLIISRFIGKLIRDELMSLRVKDYIRQNLHMLTRKIVERAGDKGDTYIAQTIPERRHLFIAASWAGVLTAFTAIIKYWIGLANFALFFEGFFFFINYAIGFLLMQHWHLALSSKQPAYTASALSKKFESFKVTKELSEIILEVRKVSYSQFIASFANLLWVVPVAFILDWLWLLTSGEHIISSHVVPDVVAKHDPFTSLTIPFAMLTGVLLWFSSVVAGWTENWIVFRNIPVLIKENTILKNLFGKERAYEIAQGFSSFMGGVAGNLSIALFLAAPIIIGKITGIPLDIRHVTLSAGTITLAFSSMAWSLDNWPLFLNMFLSIMMIGIMNFGVSFYCAIRMAALARNVDSRYLKIIFKYALIRRKKTKSSQ